MEQYENGPVQTEEGTKTKKKILWLLLLIAVILAAACFLVYGRIRDRRAEEEQLRREADPFIEENGVYDLRSAELGDGERLFALEPPVRSIDLRLQDITTETYDKLTAAYPGAEIRWTVPVGAARVDCDADTVVLPDTEEATLDALPYLKKLKLVDGTGVNDAEPLIALQAAHPEWVVRYGTNLFGHDVLSTDEWLTLNDIGTCDTDILLAALEALPNVTDIDLVGVEMTLEQKAMLRAAYPGIRWYWYVDIGGSRFKSTDEKVDFTRTDFDSFTEFLTAVGCFNAPAYVDVSTQGFQNSLMDRVIERFPDTEFAWVLRLGKYFIRTDVTVLDLSYSKGERALRDDDIAQFRYLRSLEALTLDNQALTNVSVLSGLKKLKILCLGSNRIADITPLAALENLEYLNLSNNKITDITPLSGLTKLTDLNLSENDVTSLGVLSGITGLRRVCAAKNPGLQVGEQERIAQLLPETKFSFVSSSKKIAWQDDPVFDTVNAIFTARQMSPLRAEN